MDGLMINSEPFHYQAYADVLHELGKNYPLEDNNRLYIGLSDKDQTKDMVTRYELPLSPEELMVKKQNAFKLLIHAIIPKPGLMELLKKLKKHMYKTAIASSSSKEEIALILESLALTSFIDSYCSADDVLHTKPAPDIFLLAAKKLHVKPQDCLVLEDSPRGIEAAFLAGMKSFAIPSDITKSGDYTKATLKIKSLDNVYDNLINL